MWWKMIERNSHNEELIMSEGGVEKRAWVVREGEVMERVGC